MTAFSANPYFRSKSTEHDVTLTSFTAILSKVGRHNFCNLFKIVARESIEYLATVRLKGLGDKVKNERGAMNSLPVGRGNTRTGGGSENHTVWRGGGYNAHHRSQLL